MHASTLPGTALKVFEFILIAYSILIQIDISLNILNHLKYQAQVMNKMNIKQIVFVKKS